MIIHHNIVSINIIGHQTRNHNAQSKVLEKLSSGFQVNRAGDDAAGLAISEKMRGQIRGLQMASKNIQDGISLVDVAEGGLHEIHSLLHRMRELSVQAANDTLTKEDRQLVQNEIDQLKQSIDNIAKNTNFNGIHLLNVKKDPSYYDQYFQSIDDELLIPPIDEEDLPANLVPMRFYHIRQEELGINILWDHYGVEYNGDLLVIVGQDGVIRYDGTNWSKGAVLKNMDGDEITLGSNYFKDVVWDEDNRQFVAVSNQGGVFVSEMLTNGNKPFRILCSKVRIQV